MKRRLNLFCAIVLLVLGWSVVETGYYLAIGAGKGVRAGMEYAKTELENLDETRTRVQELRNIRYVSMLPTGLTDTKSDLFLDSIYNARSGQYVPISYASLIVSVPTKESAVTLLARGLLGFAVFVMTVWALVLFIRLIVSINRSDIFNWRNVRRLRWLGSLLLLSFGFTMLTDWLNLRAMDAVFTLPGYELTLTDSAKLTSLLLGLCALIVAEVFAIGLRMKEEQDLTI